MLGMIIEPQAASEDGSLIKKAFWTIVDRERTVSNSTDLFEKICKRFLIKNYE